MTTSNVNDLIDDVDDVEDCLDRGSKRVAENEGEEIYDNVVTNYQRDPEWLGRTHKALRNQLRRHKDGKYSSHVWISGMIAPHAKIAEMGSGKRANQTSSQNAPPQLNAAPRSEYRGNHDYDAPAMSRELRLSILAWVKTKPIFADDDKKLADKIAADIADEGTYAHPFFRPAWEDRTGVPESANVSKRHSPAVRNVEDMVDDCFD